MERIKKSLGKKKKRIFIIAALVLLVLAAGYTVFIAPLLEKEQWVYKEAAVSRGTIKVGVTESGSLEYGSKSVDYDLDLDVTSDDNDDKDDDEEEEETALKYLKIEEVYVAAGQRVSQGEGLLKFTQDSMLAVRRLLENALVEAQSNYNEAESEYELSVLEAKTDYDSRKLAEKYASSIYRNATEAAANDVAAIQVEINQRTANITSLEKKVADAQESCEGALEDYREAKAVREASDKNNVDTYLSIQNTYLNAQTKYENAKSALKQAQENLEENARKIASLQIQLSTAQARISIDKLEVEEDYLEKVISGSNAEITYTAKLESLKETLEEAEEEKENIQEQLEAFEAFVGDDGILYAAETGIVTEVHYSAGDSLVNTGAILSYTPPDSMTISVDVTQEDVVDLSVGDVVDITFSAYEGTSYAGVIQSIDTTATSRNTNTISYTVVIGVEGDTTPLYGGMTADIIFVTEEKEDVLYVSRKAVVEKNGKSYVYIKKGMGRMELQEVETGINNGIEVEILSGLEEGDIIYLASRISSEEEVKSSEEASGQGGNGDMIPQEDIGMESFDHMEMPGGMNSGQMPEGMGMPQGSGNGSGGRGTQ